MGDAVDLVLQFLRTPRGRRMFRYFMASVISTMVTMVVLTLVYGVFRLWTAVPATLFANCVATVPSYFLNRNWAWGKSGRSHVWREMLPFWVASLTGIGLSIGSAALAKDFSADHHLHHLASTVVVDSANLATFVVLWIAKYLVFNRLFHVGGIAPPEEELVDVNVA